ncbi:MAG: L-serine ammonia-lyase, iron-sulfur-dependent, subunit alpha [Lutisporaceae bacterium]
MYSKAFEILKQAKEENCKISDIVLKNECKLAEASEQTIRDRVRAVLKVMQDASEAAIKKETTSLSGLIGGNAVKADKYRATGNTVCGDTVNRAIARALSSSEINASMGRIAAMPTAGANGIVPAAVITAGEKLGVDEEAMIDALLTASGVGQIIKKNATLSGAEGGCQAECGAAAAMAAAAVVEMYGGTPEMAFHAAAIALKSVLGLVCDPVAGLVEVPCSKRNASGVVNAMASADMALAGITSAIPFDEVVDAMYKIGKVMPVSLRETALGGLAATPTGQAIRCRLVDKK